MKILRNSLVILTVLLFIPAVSSAA